MLHAFLLENGYKHKHKIHTDIFLFLNPREITYLYNKQCYFHTSSIIIVVVVADELGIEYQRVLFCHVKL